VKLSLLLLSLAFFLIGPLHASILVEPLVGYNFNFKLGSTKGAGLSYGGRLGYQSEGGFQIGADYLKSSLTMDDKNFYDDTLEMSETGAFLGYKTDIFKIYLGIVFSASGSTTLVGGEKMTLEEGSATKLGLGFTGFKYVHINLELKSGKYNKIEALGLSGSDGYASTLISLSIPLTL
jgi:hypothetical protein